MTTALAYTRSLAPYMVNTVSAKVVPAVNSVLEQVLQKKIPQKLNTFLPDILDRVLPLTLTHTLTRAVGHSLVATLTHTLTHNKYVLQQLSHILKLRLD